MFSFHPFRLSILCAAAAAPFFLGAVAKADTISGMVRDSSNNAGLYRVKVSTDSAHSVYTDSTGAFVLSTDGSSTPARAQGSGAAAGPWSEWNPDRKEFTWEGRAGSMAIQIRNAAGALLRQRSLPAGASSFAPEGLPQGISFLSLALGARRSTYQVVNLGNGRLGAVAVADRGMSASAGALGKRAGAQAAYLLTCKRPGYKAVSLPLSGDQSGVEVKMGFAPTDTTTAFHDFFFSAEGVAAMSIIRNGKVTWTYTPDIKGGEISDASLLANGNVVYAWEHGASEVSPDKQIVWNYDAPANCQIHTCQPIGLDRVFIMINGATARARIINTKTNAVLMDKVVKTGGTGVHGQFRNCRMTKAGTMLLGHMDVGANKAGLASVEEYDTASMQVIWSSRAFSGPWAVVRLRNGNTLISAATSNAAYEISPAGAVVWQVSNNAPYNLPGYPLNNNQTANRLENGNTIVTNWQEPSNAAKIIEMTPSRRVIWALNTKTNVPFANTSTSIQLLDEPGAMEDFGLQR